MAIHSNCISNTAILNALSIFFSFVPRAGSPVSEGEYDSHSLEKWDLLICHPELPAPSERKTGSSPEDYQLCTVVLLLEQDIPLFAPATSSLAGIPANYWLP